MVKDALNLMKIQKLIPYLSIGAALSAGWAQAATNNLPASASLPLGTSTTRGFTVRTVQAPETTVVGNGFMRALNQLNGTLTDATGAAVPNEAVAGTNPDGSSTVDTINFELDGNPFDQLDENNNWLATFYPTAFPGIPGQNGSLANFAVEAIGYIELPAGVTTFAVNVGADRTDVNDDDGYQVSVGTNPHDFFGLKVGEYDRGPMQPFAGGQHSESTWSVDAPSAGLYPFRIVQWQTGHKSNLQLCSVDPVNGWRVLVNDPADASALKAYTGSSVAAANAPFVAHASPSAGSDGNDSAAPVTALIVDGATTVSISSVKMTLNGTAVVPQSITKSGGQISVLYNPNASRTSKDNLVGLEFKDSAGVVQTRSWSFGIVLTGGSASLVTGQWDFDRGDLSATVGKALQYFDGDNGLTKAGTEFGTTASFNLPQIQGKDVKVMKVPGDLKREIGYVMDHGIKPNGGGTRVNQYTIVFDIYVGTSGPGAASLLQTSSLNNTDDGDLFWQGSNFGQGGGGYNGTGAFTAGAWHRVAAAYDEAATPPVVTKYVDGIKQDDWTANQGLDAVRRALQPTAILFGDGDQDERREMYVNSIQIRSGKLSDAELFLLGAPSAGGIPRDLPASNVTGQWDFDQGNLSATIGKALQYFDGDAGLTKAGTEYGTTASFGLPDINGASASVMKVPGDLKREIGYIMDHGIKPNGGGTRVNQYTIVFDIYVGTSGPGAASLLQTSSLNNTDDGDLFWQGNNFGQGGGGYNGTGAFTAGAWHRVVAAYDEAATPPVVTKYVDGIKQDDWTANQGLDAVRRALQPTAILFGDGDQDERREMYVNSIQIRSGKLSDAEIVVLGGPSASGVAVAVPSSTVTGQWDFDRGNLSATIGKALQYFDGDAGLTKAGTEYGSSASFGLPSIDGVSVMVMKVPGDLKREIGYIMDHGIKPNGGGTRVNQYTIVFDIFVGTSGPGAASLLQTSSLNNTDDGDLFWQGNNFGQGGGGYNGTGAFTAGAWHRVSAAYDEAATPPVVTKYVDGIKQDDWTANQGLDAVRRALQPTAILFGDGDQDERREMYVNSIQIRAGKLSDAQLVLLGKPSATGVPIDLPQTSVTGQWDFNRGNLSATIGKALQYFDGDAGLTKAGTEYGSTESFGLPGIGGSSALVMKVPGDLKREIGYVMDHGIKPNGGGSRVNQYTIVFDIFVGTSGPGAASLLQISSLSNTDDGDLFWQGNNFGQGGGGYNGTGAFTAGAWHRVSAAYDEAATPPVVTKYVDGIKQDDWTANQGLDAVRRALQPTAILFGDGDQDERREMYVNSIQIRAGKLNDADMELLGGPTADGIPTAIGYARVRAALEVTGAVPAGLSGAPLTNIVVDEANRTITAEIPIDGSEGYLMIKPFVKILSTVIANGKLVITFE